MHLLPDSRNSIHLRNIRLRTRRGHPNGLRDRLHDIRLRGRRVLRVLRRASEPRQGWKLSVMQRQLQPLRAS